MSGFPGWRRAVRLLLSGSDMDRAVEDELEFHFEEVVSSLVAEGWSREAAEAEAVARFGDRDRYAAITRRIARRRYRASRVLQQASAVRSDARTALRALRKRPAFSGAIILVLALGVAACTTVFSFANAVLLRPLPYPNPDELVRIQERRVAPGSGLATTDFTLPDIERLRARSTALEAVAGFIGHTIPYSDAAGARRIVAGLVDPRLFSVLGGRPVLGRGLDESDAHPGGERVAVISHALWWRRFGGRTDVIGENIELNYSPHTVVGVMESGFDFPDGAQVWRPLTSDNFVARYHVVTAIGRLAPGETPATAEAEVAAIASSWHDVEPELHPQAVGVRVRGWHAQRVAGVRPAILLLGGAVGILLALVAVNLAGLLSARTIEREREVAVRRSLGATPARIAGGAICESVLLAIAGGGLGYVLSLITLSTVVGLSPAELPAREFIRADGRVALFAIALAALVGVAAGLLPALRAARVRAPLALKSDGAGATKRSGSGWCGGALIAGEVGAATLLLVGGSVLLGGFLRLVSVDTGVSNTDVWTVWLSLPGEYSEQQAFDFYARLRDGAQRLPGVTATAVSLFPPLQGSVPTAGLSADEGGGGTHTEPFHVQTVTGDYFRIAGIPVRGRTFGPGDEVGPPVAIVSRSLARRLWGDSEVEGRHLRSDSTFTSSGETSFTVVGVADDVRQNGLLHPTVPVVYLPFERFWGWGGGTLLVSSRAAPAVLIPEVRELVASLDPRLPIDQLQTIRQGMEATLAEPRFFTVMVVTFATLATLVAMAGLYGVLAYDVRRRQAELGIRAVLGARPRDNVRLMLQRAGAYLGIGVVSGVTLFLPLSRLVEGQLYGLPPTNPLAIAVAAGGMVVAGFLATLVPARRASRADPAVALRSEA